MWAAQVAELHKYWGSRLTQMSGYWKKQSQQIILRRTLREGHAQPDTLHTCRGLSLNCSQISPSIGSPRHDVGIQRPTPFRLTERIPALQPQTYSPLPSLSRYSPSSRIFHCISCTSRTDSHKFLPFPSASSSRLA